MHNLEKYLSDLLNSQEFSLSKCSASYEIRNFKKGQYLLRMGEVCRHNYFVEKGLLRMYSVDDGGKEHVIQFAPENWIISDRSSLYFKEKSAYYIEAVESSEVVLLSPEFFVELKNEFPVAVATNDLLLQKHILNLQKRVNSLLADTAEQRYLDFIQMYPDIMLRVPQWMVASYLGITPESLSRVRKELTKKDPGF